MKSSDKIELIYEMGVCNGIIIGPIKYMVQIIGLMVSIIQLWDKVIIFKVILITSKEVIIRYEAVQTI
jgi:hypothetical protein